MRRELLLLEKMAEAAEQAQRLVDGVSVHLLADDRVRRDALLWNVTFLGEAASQLPGRVQGSLPGGAVAAASPSAKPDRARLLVGRSGRSAHDGTVPPAGLCGRGASCPGVLPEEDASSGESI